MTYTFLHRGIVIGESDLDSKSKRVGQRAGAFQPTNYGRTLMPKVTCGLTAGLALKNRMESMLRPSGRSELSGEEIDKLFMNTPEGRAMIELGRTLSEITLQGSDGRLIEFSSVAFSNVEEIRRVGARTSADVDELEDLPPDAPEFIVSVTLKRERTSNSPPIWGGLSRAGRYRH